ncbi:MAG: thioredoxin reductase [Patescibacteria group bacterium]|jgi:thioredoxin reductase (NADPH)|nr:thioredoxin reductase [Patescibacteria group bacterium]
MSKTKTIYDVIIIGAGPAGYTAAIYTSRASLKTLMIAGDTPGGQLLLTSEVENFPGFKDGIMGPELMDEMKAQALRFGTEFRADFVTKVELNSKIKKVSVGDEVFESKTVIIATGASANWLGLKNEQRLMGKGISACATCDGFFFTGKHVIVAGGGDSAMEEALTLAKFADKVTIVHRRDEFRASKIMQDRVKEHKKIDIIYNAEVVDVLGDDFVEGVVLKDTQDNKETQLDCGGLFVAIGHTPATKLFEGVLDLDDKKYLISNPDTSTKIDGVFAAGDVSDKRYRQAITAAGEGCKAALEAEHYISS